MPVKKGNIMTIRWIEMTSGEALALIIHLAWPILAGAIVVSVAIAVFQAATQVQEQSLSFVPKILITFYMVYERGPYIWQKMQSFLLKMLYAAAKFSNVDKGL